jgi:hypothetical protein
VKWESVNPAVATVDASGKVTAVSQGSTSITATMQGGGGPAVGETAITVASNGTGGSTRSLQSLTIIPATGFQVTHAPFETAQYIAIGTFNASPTTEDMTSQVMWQSSDVRVATINNAGLATTVGSIGCTGDPCKTQITATATTASGATIYSTSDLTVRVDGSVTLPSLTVYMVGLGTGTVTSNPPGINCSSGADAGCTGHFVKGTTVTLTATPDPGSQLGGWSSNCLDPNAAACQIPMGDNDNVGVIFNPE